jgi:hypothetical protein
LTGRQACLDLILVARFAHGADVTLGVLGAGATTTVDGLVHTGAALLAHRIFGGTTLLGKVVTVITGGAANTAVGKACLVHPIAGGTATPDDA